MVVSQDNGTKKRRYRRSNGRSITGCLPCRQRRIKGSNLESKISLLEKLKGLIQCDEKRPRCLNCKQSHACTYNTLDPAKEWRQKILTFNLSPAPAQPVTDDSYPLIIRRGGVPDDKRQQENQVDTRLPTSHCPPSSVSPLVGEGYDIQDVQLLSHFVTSTAHCVIGQQEEWIYEGVQLAFTNDFLMHALLMTAASHLDQMNPRSCDYALHITRHLHHSLTSFRKYLSTHTSISSNVDAVVATCFLFIVHSYSQPIFEPASSIIDPLLCHSSGVFDIIRCQHDHAWPSLFQPVCTPELLPAMFPRSGPAFDLILMVMTGIPNSTVPDPNEHIYFATIESLTLILETITTRPQCGKTPPQSLLLYLVKWLSFLPTQFTALVNMHDAKALVIMAHYYAIVASILSNAKTDWWWMRERPVYMIQQVTTFLGRPWDIWMKWPNEVILRYQEAHRSKDVHDDIVKNISSVDNTTLGVLSRTLPHRRKIGAE